MSNNDCNEGFCGIGHWEGVAEVYDGEGHFLANGADQRHVRTQTEDGRTRIDLSFAGPLKFSGHYYIQSQGQKRLYQGPANCGFADALGRDCVTAHGYWPSTGLTQKFFLIAAPDGKRQMSLALMSRGEHLLYVVVGENAKVIANQPQVDIPMVSGIAFDLKNDPKAGRDCLYLHKEGYWEGEVSSLIDNRSSTRPFRQSLKLNRAVLISRSSGSIFAEECELSLKTNDRQAWSEFGDYVGSYSLYGGRALSGEFHHLPSEQRVWRREVVSADGQYKAMVNIWYQGEEKRGSEWAILKFRES